MEDHPLFSASLPSPETFLSDGYWSALAVLANEDIRPQQCNTTFSTVSGNHYGPIRRNRCPRAAPYRLRRRASLFSGTTVKKEDEQSSARVPFVSLPEAERVPVAADCVQVAEDGFNSEGAKTEPSRDEKPVDNAQIDGEACVVAGEALLRLCALQPPRDG